MKIQPIIIVILLIFCGFTCKAQEVEVVNANPNDTTFTRVYNGVLVSDDFHVQSYKSIKVIADRSELLKLNLYPKPLMIIESDKTDIEYQIESRLFTNKIALIRSLDYPLVKRPIAIDGKIVALSSFTNISPSSIKSVSFSKKTVNDGVYTPFGVIEVMLY
ncbi:hypothetical protein [Pseudopedobacter beijingensis]|uniref:Uncharacterized protein n=1 Tax=Pseudopedobacter beijingensis TaxID=1207056 RepID=A0ABW4IAJ2_9SPHI